MCGARVADDNNKKRSQLVAVTASLLIIALCNTAVQLTLAKQQQFQRRNLQWLSATGGTWSGTQPQKAVTEYHRDRLSANYRFVYSRRFTILQIAQTIPQAEFTVAFSHRRNLQWLSATGGIVSGDSPQALSRCRLLQRKYQRIADPMRKHRHNAPLYCPYIRLQESYLPSFHHLYRRQ